MKGPPTGGRGVTTRLRTAKGRSTASQKWLERQLNDPYVRAAQATGHLRIMALAELALDFALKVLAPGGGFVAKVFQGGSEKGLLEELKQRFAVVRHMKPPASRKDSSELYVVATGFRPAEAAR